MAKKQRVRIKNSRPRHNWPQRKIKNTAGEGSSSASGNAPGCVDPGHTGGGSATINDVVKHSIHEVGQSGSSFPGTDSYGKPIEGATFADREKLYHRYDLIESLKENAILDDDGFPSDSDIEMRQYLYDQPTKEGSGSQQQKIMIRKEEDSTALLPTYDEQYFQHIFNWPLTHALRERKIAGFIEKTCTTTTSSSTGGQNPKTCSTSRIDKTLEVQEQNYNVTFTLDDVETEIYQVNPAGDSTKGDQIWNYDTLTFDSTTGELQNKNSGLRDKLGHPIVYSGDWRSSAIFFNYMPDDGAHSTTVIHEFDETNDVDISFTTTGGITVVPKKRPGLSGNFSGSTNTNSINRRHYEITFPKAILNTANIRINLNQLMTASGVPLSRMFVSKLTQISDRTIRVWFNNDTNQNSFARNWTISLGGGEKSTKDVIAIGDSVNGSTVTNVVNYVEEVALIRTVVGQPKKGVQDSGITETNFKALLNADGNSQGLETADYQRTRAWIKINDINDITKGMDIQGHGIKNRTTTVTGVDYTNHIVYISDTIKEKKLKTIKFIDDQCNRVSQHTLCYATLSGGNDFVMDADYNVTRNDQPACDIRVRAGKGIKNRSAVVGTWFSDVKHEIEYQPIFYGIDSSCEKEIDSDNFGEYTLGTIIWEDNTRTEGLYLLTNPADNFAYTASQVHFALTYTPIDQATLNKIDMEVASELSSVDINSSLGRMNQTDPTLTSRYIIFNKVSEHCKDVLGGKRAAAVYDDICRDDIRPMYFNMYDPIDEQYSLGTNLTGIQQNITDYCGVTNPILNPSLQGAESAAQQSTVLPDEYYKQFVSNPDSLLNRLKNGFNIVENARPKNKVVNLPPQIVGEDQSGRVFTSKSFRNLPPKTDRVGYFCNDLIVTDDKYLNPILDLDPETTINQPKILIRSRPKWTANNPVGETWNISISSGAGPLSTTMSVTVNKDGNGHVGNITTSNGPDDDEEVTTGFPPNTTTTKCEIKWIPLRSKEADGNIVFCTRDAFPGVYTISTNVTRPPGGNHDDSYARTDLRDLLYKERPKDENVLATDGDDYDNSMLHLPAHAVYPSVVWEPNVNFQQDFYKMFEFRLQEHSELIGETIANKGNPYVDRAITTKLRENLDPTDNDTIVVESTGEFLSSGYLIIPKYTQKIVALETGNNNSYYYYSGEEIIYYKSKTETTFNGITRRMFGTTSSFEDTVSVESIEPGVVYKIASLGSSNWESIGAGKNPSVGDVFTSTGDGIGTGTAIVFGTTSSPLPDEELLIGLLSNPKIPVITSYEKGFSIAQHAIFTLKY